MSYKKGIDISEHQGSVDFAALKNDIDFLILREGYRASADEYFFEYVEGARAAGIPILGVYHFIYVDSVTIQANVDATIRNLKKAGFDLSNVWVFCDLEYDTYDKLGIDDPERTTCTNWTKAYCDGLRKAGVKNIGIYTNLDFYNNYYDWSKLPDYSDYIWLADYTGGPDKPCIIQQYTSKRPVSGIADTVDADYLIDDSIWVEAEPVDERSIPEKAITWMEDLATDNSHGYSQYDRWGPDYDCSSAVFTAWQEAGIPVKTYALSHDGCAYTGNLYSVFTHFGFKDVTSSVNLSTGAGLKRGDILLNHTHHVAMFCGSGREVEASISETGGVSGKTGDQTGREILIRPYRNYPWNCVLRYGDGAEEQEGDGVYMFSCKEIQKGSKGADVLLLQTLLKGNGYKGADKKVLAMDGDFGANTDYALRKYQKATAGLAVDGVCGEHTWAAIVGL